MPLNLSGFYKAEAPKEGETRDFKDGVYKFIEGHWRKVKKEEKKEINISNEKQEFEISEKINFSYNEQKFKAEIIEAPDNKRYKIKILEKMPIPGISTEIKEGTTFIIGKKTLSKIND